MDAAAEAAVGAGDDVFLADDISEGDDAIGDQFWVLISVQGLWRICTQRNVQVEFALWTFQLSSLEFDACA